MKFSQFDKPNKIIEEFTDCIKYLNENQWFETTPSMFYLIPKLNLALNKNASLNLFFALTKEYRSNQSKIVRFKAIGYICLIAIAIKLKIAHLFVQIISLDGPLFYPAIIGGNNRLRMVDSSSKNAIVVAKDDASKFFTKNAIKAFASSIFSNKNIIPEIYIIDDRVYFEKQIDGIAINRIAQNKHQQLIISTSIKKFFEIQNSYSREIPFKTFLRYKIWTIKNYVKKRNNPEIMKLLECFISKCDLIYMKLGNIMVSICQSHGDLNKGNVFLHKETLSIIDWEYFMHRYSPYDSVIFKNNLRHLSFDEYKEFFSNNNERRISLYLFLLEELAFRIMNYKEDVSNSKAHIKMINDLLNKI